MSMPSLPSAWSRAKTVTLNTRQATAQDGLGNDVYVTVKSQDIPMILVPQQMKLAPRATRGGSFAEELQGEFVVASGYTGFAPLGTVITVIDEIIIDGEAWRVSGVPGNYQSPFTGTAGACQVELARVTG